MTRTRQSSVGRPTLSSTRSTLRSPSNTREVSRGPVRLWQGRVIRLSHQTFKYTGASRAPGRQRKQSRTTPVHTSSPNLTATTRSGGTTTMVRHVSSSTSSTDGCHMTSSCASWIAIAYKSRSRGASSKCQRPSSSSQVTSTGRNGTQTSITSPH